MEPLLEISHVNYSYHSMQGETPALTNVHFHVDPGTFVAIVGPSGCGNAMAFPWQQSLFIRIWQLFL